MKRMRDVGLVGSSDLGSGLWRGWSVHRHFLSIYYDFSRLEGPQDASIPCSPIWRC